MNLTKSIRKYVLTKGYCPYYYELASTNKHGDSCVVKTTLESWLYNAYREVSLDVNKYLMNRIYWDNKALKKEIMKEANNYPVPDIFRVYKKDITLLFHVKDGEKKVNIKKIAVGEEVRKLIRIWDKLETSNQLPKFETLYDGSDVIDLK